MHPVFTTSVYIFPLFKVGTFNCTDGGAIWKYSMGVIYYFWNEQMAIF